MPVWSVSDINEEPEITLIRWNILELPDGSRHFIGYNLYGREGRVSSCIKSFDKEKSRGITHSNRVYELSGPPGHDKDGWYVWSRWCKINCVEAYKDVSSEYAKENHVQ